MRLMSRIKNSLLYRSRVYARRGKVAILGVYRTFSNNRSGINLVGYFSYTFGVAEVGRFFAQHAKKAGVPFRIYDMETPSHKKLDEISLEFYRPYFTYRPPYQKNVFFVNADQIANLKDQLPELFAGRYNAAVFFWEFNDYFNFPQAFKVINEVFAFTDFIATAVRKVAPRTVKVTKLPFPFIQNWQITKPAGVIREQYNIPSDAFVFIFNFDFFSVYERKNPEAILRAFKLAFSAGENVYLVLKTIHGEAVSETNTSFQVLVNHMVSKDKIVVVNDNLDRNDFMNLINASDCYISLHRSEGLGLGMLEAMSMGKPVIATNFGGNTDFMRQDNSLLVDYSLVAVKENAKPYQPGWLWAEADVQQAADYMLRLVEDRAFANELGKRARESVQKQYGNDVFEKTLNDWIKS